MKAYNYYIVKNKVVCTAKLGNKKFRTIATCSPEDTFDEEKGKALSAARMDVKLAAYRLTQRLVNLKELNERIEYLKKLKYKKVDKIGDIQSELVLAVKNLNSLTEELE